MKMTLAKVEESESETFQSKDKVKMTLFKAKESKKDNHKRESSTCKNRGAQKKQLRKLTGIVVQLQSK